jgi:hypothetical protein
VCWSWNYEEFPLCGKAILLRKKSLKQTLFLLTDGESTLSGLIVSLSIAAREE